MSDLLSARAMPAIAPPPLTTTLRCHLLRGFRATLRRDLDLAERLRQAKEPHDHIIRRIACTRADLAELEAEI